MPNPKQEYIIIWGGPDINPFLYNRTKSNYTGVPFDKLDALDIEKIKQAMKDEIPIIGICRGAQILNVLNGGILVQHIEEHTKPHNIDINYNGLYWKELSVTSTHHQMMIAHQSGEVIGKSFQSVSGVHWNDVNEPYVYSHVPEVILYKETKSLCIQPHPEWMNQKAPFIAVINHILHTEFQLEPINFKEEETNYITRLTNKKPIPF